MIVRSSGQDLFGFLRLFLVVAVGLTFRSRLCFCFSRLCGSPPVVSLWWRSLRLFRYYWYASAPGPFSGCAGIETADDAQIRLAKYLNHPKITLIIKALNYAKPSPAQRPSPAQPGREKIVIIFRFFFRQRYSRTVKSCCSKIEKKFFGSTRFSMKINVF